MYCDYNFYESTYHGNVIDRESFDRLCDRASDKLDYHTMERLEVVEEKPEDSEETVYVIYMCGELLDEKTEIKVKKAVCKIAEIIYDIEQFESQSRSAAGFESTDSGLKGKVISSVSSGTESISYATGTADKSYVADLAKDKNATEQYIYESIREYLSGTGLLYAGL